MAKFEIKFFDCEDLEAHIQTEIEEGFGKEKVIRIFGISDTNESFNLWLDKSTAIKFAKTLRTEINKITESEVLNG